MGQIVFGAVTPHPPIIIEQVGGTERLKAEATITGLENLARDLVAAGPETLVIVSPHAPVFEDGIVIMGQDKLSGSFASFGAPSVALTFQTDQRLAQEIVDQAKQSDIVAVLTSGTIGRDLGISQVLDHGAAVPLSFLLQAGFKGQIVLMGMALFPPDELYEFGRAIQAAVEVSQRRVAVIASGDLSHRLTPDASAGYNPRGKEFDALLVERLRSGDFTGIMDIDPELVEAAGECGYRPVNILLGAFDGYNTQTKIYSYQGPYGVGYLVAGLSPLGRCASAGGNVESYRSRRQGRLQEQISRRHPVVQLAAASLEHFLREGRYLKDYNPLPHNLPQRAGVFVSLKKHGALRGCIGTTAPTAPDLAQEVINNAVSAGTEDPRFFPVELSELDELTISVDILAQEEPITGPEQLDPQKYGVIVRRGARTGLLLPNLPGVDTVEEQIKIARQKAGIGPHEPVELSRFAVQRFY